jgi:hypothetical protein
MDSKQYQIRRGAEKDWYLRERFRTGNDTRRISVRK